MTIAAPPPLTVTLPTRRAFGGRCPSTSCAGFEQRLEDLDADDSVIAEERLRGLVIADDRARVRRGDRRPIADATELSAMTGLPASYARRAAEASAGAVAEGFEEQQDRARPGIVDQQVHELAPAYIAFRFRPRPAWKKPSPRSCARVMSAPSIEPLCETTLKCPARKPRARAPRWQQGKAAAHIDDAKAVGSENTQSRVARHRHHGLLAALALGVGFGESSSENRRDVHNRRTAVGDCLRHRRGHHDEAWSIGSAILRSDAYRAIAADVRKPGFTGTMVPGSHVLEHALRA
jgi:hypothetical protein